MPLFTRDFNSKKHSGAPHVPPFSLVLTRPQALIVHAQFQNGTN